MSIPNKEIVGACWELLNSVQRHKYGANEREFLTVYQIWPILQEEGNPICQTITNKCGTAVGRDGGAPVGPVQRIAQALGHSDLIETHYLDTRRITIAGVRPSGSSCGLFRIRG